MTQAISQPKLVTVFGGSGFVGRHVVRALAKRGWRVRVACRRPDLAGHLRPLGNVGQVTPVQANLRYRWSVDRAMEGADAAINLVGILHGSGAQTFDAVQGFGARAVAEAARATGASLVHMSAIGADADSASAYARTKAEGEAAALETVPGAVIMRPSVVFGPEDDFFNRFADMARLSPALPLIGGGETKLQPVYVGDVAEAFARALEGGATPGAIYEIGGPEVLTFKECMQRMLKVTDRKRMLVDLPFPIAGVIASVSRILPKPPITPDQVILLKQDNVVSAEAKAENRTLAGLGIQATALDAILPSYLWRFRVAGQYTHPDAA